jgi:UrcA family protein
LRNWWLPAAALLIAAPAAASPDAAPAAVAEAPAPHAVLSLRGVDLSDPAARAALERRIDRVAAEICGVSGSADPTERHRAMSCLVATGNAARAELARRAERGAGTALAPARMAGI